ncbi:exo-beta-1-3-glucanase (GH5-family) member of the ScExg1-family [Penicillium hetheringtonii]|uniref:Exo-beta-1-3-glucanase (GH5-family) member of the ScExg1-family n=1 Tax=Penicillium hetheringtonii TaxID=911720 RepID=A0AAD6DKB1_9EURO|nr:exo-beta-1-3-glucanase (GH5-family) member of the ScExg1-family [Penicillium hetheringtonii]
MRVVVGLHSLPGELHQPYSYEAIDQVLQFFVEKGYPWALTISHINEASDNPSAFASPNTSTINGTNWIIKYTNGVLTRIARVDKLIPLMLQDCFLGEEHWSSLFPSKTNLVIDTHLYYFAASGAYSQ